MGAAVSAIAQGEAAFVLLLVGGLCRREVVVRAPHRTTTRGRLQPIVLRLMPPVPVPREEIDRMVGPRNSRVREYGLIARQLELVLHDQ